MLGEEVRVGVTVPREALREEGLDEDILVVEEKHIGPKLLFAAHIRQESVQVFPYTQDGRPQPHRSTMSLFPTEDTTSGVASHPVSRGSTQSEYKLGRIGELYNPK